MFDNMNFTKNKKLRTHKVSEVRENDNVKIIVDTRISTDINIQTNRPDLIVFDKRKKEIKGGRNNINKQFKEG